MMFEHGDDAVGAATADDKSSMAIALESEREMRVKLEKLLEVQTVQVDLQKELRVKTESLLQVEQQTTSRLRAAAEQMRLAPGDDGQQKRNVAAAEERFAQAQDRIKVLERCLADATAPETSDRNEAHLRKQIEEQERTINNLQERVTATSDVHRQTAN
jgi:hypothetical protein